MRIDYSPAEAAHRRSARRVMLAAALCVVGSAALMSRESVATRHAAAVSEPLLPETQALLQAGEAYDQAIQQAVADQMAVPEASEWVTLRIAPGQSLSSVFEDQALPPEDWMALLKLGGDALQLKRIKAGDELHLRKVGDRLEELSYALDELRTLTVRREGERFEATTLTAELERRHTQATGVVSSSLYGAGMKAGLSDRMTMEMAEIFGYDIDFVQDIREGDRFAVVYEELYRDGKKLRDGDILAAEFVNQGKTYRAVRDTDADGRAAYYTPEGQSLRKAFIRTPLDFARVSSPFNLKRRHPILNSIRAHKGVDYAAASGTPIKAAGDGKVAFLGVKGGYGKVVILQHGNQTETLYAHMSRYRPGLKAGSRVKQGQVIGYVGSTGLATAPHLHYEFRVAGVHKDPVKVSLPRANPLSGSQLAAFKARSSVWLAELEAVSRSTQTAGGPALGSSAR